MPPAGKPFLSEWGTDKMQTVSDLRLQAQDVQMQDCIYKVSAAEVGSKPRKEVFEMLA